MSVGLLFCALELLVSSNSAPVCPLTLQLVMPGDRKEMLEFQDKAAGNTQMVLELTLPNVNLLLPSKDFFETLYNR